MPTSKRSKDTRSFDEKFNSLFNKAASKPVPKGQKPQKPGKDGRPARRATEAREAAVAPVAKSRTDRIRDELALIEHHGRLTWDAMKRCGQMLLEEKKAQGHGNWLSWLAANLPDLNERTARRYMEIAEGKLPFKTDTVSDLPEPLPTKRIPMRPRIQAPAPDNAPVAEPVPGDPEPINALAEKIKASAVAEEKAMTACLLSALEVGRLLMEARAGHASEADWDRAVKANLNFSAETAQEYMRLAGYWDGLTEEQRREFKDSRDLLRRLAALVQGEESGFSP